MELGWQLKPFTDCASAPQVGMHFMNPVPVMPLVEIIRGIATSDEVRPNFFSHQPCAAEDISPCKRIHLVHWLSPPAA